MSIEDRIKHVIAEIEALFGKDGHALATAIANRAVDAGHVSVTDPNPDPGQVASTIAPAAAA